MRINLVTPFAEKDDAKKLGAKWDSTRKCWYIVDVADLTPFMRWIPDLEAAAGDESMAGSAVGPIATKKAAPFKERLQLDVTIDDNLVLVAKARSLNVRGLAEAEVHDLEFALHFPSGGNGWKHTTAMSDSSEDGARHESGDLVMRSNIAAQENSFLVPGEVLYRFDPLYFDMRKRPPQIQIDEKLYYEPCVYCRRASNDPLCRCSTSAASRAPPFVAQQPGGAN
jgi:hypothetical protein